MEWKTRTNLFLCTMSLFSKIFNLIKRQRKTQLNKIIDEAIVNNYSTLKRLDDDVAPPIIGDDYPTYEQIIKEYESQNPK